MLIKKNKKCSQSLALFSIAIPFLKMWKQLVYAWNMNISQFQFSLAPWQIGSSGGHEGHFSRDPLPVFSAGCPCEQFWHGPGCSLFEAVHPVFPLPTTESPTHKGTLKDGFGKAVMACDMPEPWKILPLDRCQKRFLWTHKEVDLAPHPVVGLVFQAGSADSRTLITLTQISESADRSYPWLINDFCAE